MKTVITIKAYKRCDYLKQVLDRLYINKNLPDLYITIDKDDKTKADMLKLVSQYDGLQCVYQNKKLGCAGNMKNCFDYAFTANRYNYMIHLEDDTIPGGDFLNWMMWAGEQMVGTDIFAACPYRSNDAQQSFCKISTPDISKNHISSKFECQGGFGILRSSYEENILSRGGIFGMSHGDVGLISNSVSNEVKQFLISKGAYDRYGGSWARPFNEFFLSGKKCLFPHTCRSNNIGAVGGEFNQSAKWHTEHVMLAEWLDKWDPNVKISYSLDMDKDILEY